MLNKKVIGILIFILCSTAINAQWSKEWTSNSISSYTTSGFMSFEKSGSEWLSRIYFIDTLKFQVMSSGYSTTPEYTYTFTTAERNAGQLIYSLNYDLTGDNITEFYVLGKYGSTDAYRQSFRIVDITTGNNLLVMDDATHYYTYPTIWDADDDGELECSFASYDYPNFAGYTYEVYNTGVTLTGIANTNVEPRFELNQNYPNPFNPSTKISFSTSNQGNVKVQIFDIRGALVTTLVNDYLDAGYHELEWNARNQSGVKVASGAYFYKISTENLTATKKMIFIK